MSEINKTSGSNGQHYAVPGKCRILTVSLQDRQNLRVRPLRATYLPQTVPDRCTMDSPRILKAKPSVAPAHSGGS